jgi:ATP-dependent DNA ligase
MTFERLEVRPGLEPMEAKLVDSLPAEPGWRFEPKWDGFRCLVFKDGEEVELQSKAGKPLGRYFPEVEAAVRALQAERLVLDGELVIETGGKLAFDALQARLHPAESRIRKLAAETPARIMVFDRLADDGGASLLEARLTERRQALEALVAAEGSPDLLLSPYADDLETARGWLEQVGGALDGVIAKRGDDAYQPGERAMLKVKRMRTADCVVGGFRYASGAREVGSLLLGLFDAEGKLNHVGFTSGIAASARAELTGRLEALVEAPGFTGKAPGGPSRWSSDRSADWQPLRPELVVEVRYDHVTGDRFRHGTRLLRWRPDKAPRQCRMEQLEPEAAPALIAAALERPA